MVSRIYLKLDDIGTDGNIPQSQSQLHDDSSLLRESTRQVRQQISYAIDEGDFIRAIALLNHLIKDFGIAEDYNNRGLVHFWRGSWQKAFWDFNRAIAMNPELAAAYNNRANYYASQGRKKNALEDYERAIDLDPFYVRARINRAITLRELDCFDAALDGFEDALLFRQLAGEIYAERGRTYHLRGDWNCAIADYRRALKFFPVPTQGIARLIPPRRRQILTWLKQLDNAA